MNVVSTFVDHNVVSYCKGILDTVTAILFHDASWLCQSREPLITIILFSTSVQ